MDIIEQKKSDLYQQLDDIKVVLMELTNLEESCLTTLSAIDNKNLTNNL
jgi:hypothetical protein